ncbi:MAG: DUF6318 family protein, partial [Actinomycetes bacterium]
PTPRTGPTDSPAEKPSLPEAGDTLAGEKAFAKYVLHAWEYTLATNDYSAMAAADPAGSCKGCPELEADAEENRANGSYLDDPAVTIHSVELTDETKGEKTVGLTVSSPAVKRMNVDGTVEEEYPASKKFYFEVGMTFEGDHFQMTRFAVD